MSETITQAFVQQFDATLREQAQQKVSRLEMACVDRGTITGSSFTANRLAPLDDTPEDDNRHGDTSWSDITHSTRLATMKDYFQALPIDKADLPKMIANPNGAYVEALKSAFNRRKDSIIYAALLGNSQTKDGGTVALPSTQIIVNGAAGFTKAKLIQARAMFRAKEADNHNGEVLNIIYNSTMLEDILNDTTLTHADYLAVQMLQSGDVSKNWMGFNWIPYEAITVSGGVASTVAWCSSSLHRGTGFIEGDVGPRRDKKNTIQCSMAASFGAIRVEEEKVVQIDFTV
jgi:hypothetical protein